MKKMIVSIIMSFMVLTISNIAFADTPSKAVVNATAVRIRESASTDSNIVVNAYEDDEVEVLEENGEWYKVQYGNSVGYAKKEFFTITKEGDITTYTETNTTEPENTVNETSEQTIENEVAEPEVQQPAQPETTENDVAENIETENSFTVQTPLKLRILPSLGATEKLEIPQGEQVVVETKIGNWCKLTNDVIAGWIPEEKLQLTLNPTTDPMETTQEPEQPAETPEENTVQSETTSEEEPEETTENTTTKRTGMIIVETARVRKSASSSADVIDTLDEDKIVTILGEEGEFYKISTDTISEGYISKTLIREKDVTSRSSQTERDNTISLEANEQVNQSLSNATTNTVVGEDVVAFAKQYLGYKYVSGGSSPEAGFDCSGFTRYIFGHFGYSLGRVAADQTSVGAVVERADLGPGDLLLFYDDAKTKIGHCGIYIGGGDFIHSANPQRGVVIDNLNTSSYYNARFVTARRIVEK